MQLRSRCLPGRAAGPPVEAQGSVNRLCGRVANEDLRLQNRAWGKARAGSGFDSASMGARRVHTFVPAKSRSDSFALGSWSNILRIAEKLAPVSKTKCSVSKEPACEAAETLMPP